MDQRDSTTHGALDSVIDHLNSESRGRKNQILVGFLVGLAALLILLGLAQRFSQHPAVPPPAPAFAATATAPPAFGYLQATSNTDIATLYYRDETGAEKGIECSPDSERIRLPVGRYRVRIEDRNKGVIAHEQTIDIISDKSYYLGPDEANK